VAGDLGIARQPDRPAHRRAQIRDVAATPAAHLVAKHAQAPEAASADGARGDDAPARLVGVGRRSELDRVPLLADVDGEHRVVEVAARPVAAGGRDRLEHAPVEAHAVAARAERDPVQVDGCRAGRIHRCRAASPGLRRPASGRPHTMPAGCPQAEMAMAVAAAMAIRGPGYGRIAVAS
jgi:hypothetical protein